MKQVLFVFCVSMAFSAQAFADSSEMRAFKNFDKKIAALENYTVTHLKPGQKLSVSASQSKSGDALEVKLIPKKKS